MGWQRMQFERTVLYEEVWREAVTKVAKRYGLSDVGLRKICRKLEVPLPPLGYWAKLQYGKAPPRPPLPARSDKQTLTHERWIPSRNEELERRIAESTTSAVRVPPVVEVSLKSAVEACAPVVRSTAARLRVPSGDDRGFGVAKGPGVFWLTVSPANRQRMLLLLDGIVTACAAAGFRLVVAKSSDEPAQFDVGGERFTVRLSERSKRTERKLTAQELREQAKGGYFYIPNRYSYAPTNEFKLEVFAVPREYSLLSHNDSPRRKLEARLADLPAELAQLSLRVRVERQLHEERARAEELRRAERARLAGIRRAQLERLKEVEKAAAQLHRAEVLRSYADKLREKSRAPDTDAKVQWIARAADWLDPTVKRHWPEVDDAPETDW